EQGRAVSEKKADRIAAEGVVDILKVGAKTAMVEVNCETDFVARNESFKEFVRNILKTIIDKAPATVEELKALPYN
ncbi:MAG: elongation factor Ts, partial [Clostridia bacterium]|nr:elongation factor Ts [Clostridia bacterium]